MIALSSLTRPGRSARTDNLGEFASQDFWSVPAPDFQDGVSQLVGEGPGYRPSASAVIRTWARAPSLASGYLPSLLRPCHPILPLHSVLLVALSHTMPKLVCPTRLCRGCLPKTKTQCPVCEVKCPSCAPCPVLQIRPQVSSPFLEQLWKVLRLQQLQ